MQTIIVLLYILIYLCGAVVSIITIKWHNKKHESKWEKLPPLFVIFSWFFIFAYMVMNCCVFIGFIHDKIMESEKIKKFFNC
jgi:hypothetical protein